MIAKKPSVFNKSARILIFFSFCWVHQALSAEAPRDPYQYFFNETWGDFSEEIANAKAQGKQYILVFFEMDECPFCHYMKENVLNQALVQAYFRKYFLSFSVDIEGDIELTDFIGNVMTQKVFASKKNRVRATPVFAFFDLTGKRVARFIGRTSGVDEFMLLGRYVAEAHFKEMSFTRFKRKK